MDLGSEILVEVLPLGETSSGEGVNDQRHVYEKAYEKVGTVSCSTYIFPCMILNCYHCCYLLNQGHRGFGFRDFG